MGVGPLARWKEAELPDLASRLKWAAGAAVVATLLDACGCAGGIGIVGAVGLLMAFWIIGLGRHRPASSGCGRPAACAPASLHRARLIPRAIVGMHARAPRRRRLHPRRDAGEAPARSSATCGCRSATRRRSATWSSPSAACATCSGPNYRAAQGTIEVTDNGRPVVDPASREAPLSGDAVDHDRGRDRRRPDARPLRLARRAGRRRRLDRPRLRQAVRRLDLGRLPGDGARRPARRQRPALSRQGAAHGARPRPAWRAQHEAILVPHPAGGLPGARGRARGRPEARSARGAVAADRQAGAEVRAAAARRRRQDDPPRRHARQGLGAQRLGLVVRRLPRGASAAGRVREEARGAALRPQLQGQARGRHRAGSPASATPTTPRSTTTKAGSASTSASTACPRPSSSTRTASSA